MITPAARSEPAWDTLSRLTPLIGLGAGGVYALGYLIISMYLSRYGVAGLNLVQARYFTAGLLYLGLAALVLSGTLVGLPALRRPAPGTGRLPGPARVALVAAADLFLTAVVIWAAGQILTGADREGPFVKTVQERRVFFWAGLTASQIALAFPLAAGWLLRRFTARQGGWLGFGLLFSSLAAVCVAISLFVFAVFVYPAVSPAFGGGAPIRAQLLLKQAGYAATLSLPAEAGLTEPLTLLDQTDVRIIVLDARERVLEFSMDEVAAVVRP